MYKPLNGKMFRWEVCTDFSGWKNRRYICDNYFHHRNIPTRTLISSIAPSVKALLQKTFSSFTLCQIFSIFCEFFCCWFRWKFEQQKFYLFLELWFFFVLALLLDLCLISKESRITIEIIFFTFYVRFSDKKKNFFWLRWICRKFQTFFYLREQSETIEGRELWGERYVSWLRKLLSLSSLTSTRSGFSIPWDFKCIAYDFIERTKYFSAAGKFSIITFAQLHSSLYSFPWQEKFLQARWHTWVHFMYNFNCGLR